LERTVPFSSGAEQVILNHLLNCGLIKPHWDKQVDFEPPAEGITGAAVAAVCGGLRWRGWILTTLASSKFFCKDFILC
jgi:hypothetical protein